MRLKEIDIAAKTLEEALSEAASQLEVSSDKVQYRVNEQVKKGLFKGPSVSITAWIEEKGRSKRTYTGQDPVEASMEYLQKILTQMDIGEFILEKADRNQEGGSISIKSKELENIVKQNLQVLDSLQYLASLIANRCQENYFRLTLDLGDFRKNREETLNALAERIANRVKKTNRNCTLETMNPYERRIIHAAITDIEGVISKSVGDEPHRKVIIMSTAEGATNAERYEGRERGGRRGNQGGRHRSNKNEGAHEEAITNRRGAADISQNVSGLRSVRKTKIDDSIFFTDETVLNEKTESETENNAPLYGKLDI